MNRRAARELGRGFSAGFGLVFGVTLAWPLSLAVLAGLVFGWAWTAAVWGWPLWVAPALLIVGPVVLRLLWEWAYVMEDRLAGRAARSQVEQGRGWNGELFEVYVYYWPPENRLPAALRGRGLGGRMAYIGKSSDEVERARAHVRERRVFVLPYGRKEVVPFPSRAEMDAEEIRLIRQADAAGEPIVNRQLHRTRR